MTGRTGSPVMAQKMQTYDGTRLLKKVTPEYHRNPNVERNKFLTAQVKSCKKTIPKVFCWSWAYVE